VLENQVALCTHGEAQKFILNLFSNKNKEILTQRFLSAFREEYLSTMDTILSCKAGKKLFVQLIFYRELFPVNIASGLVN
jgi:Na+-transporting NADH:ubiquinone oxidoreductase subunit NqrA